MGEAKPKSWKRDLARAVLLAVLLVGLPAAGMAGAHYRKHVEACYWAWQWVRATERKRKFFHLAAKLDEVRAPRQARAVACLLAYQLSGHDFDKQEAAYCLGRADLRRLYELARADGLSSPAELALHDNLRALTCDPQAVIDRSGATAIYVDVSPPATSKPDEPWAYPLSLRFDYGSYRVRCHASWRWHDSPDGTGEWKHTGFGVHVDRVAACWRDLPPPRPESPDDEERYKEL